MTNQTLNLTTKVGKVTVEGVIGNSPGPRKSLKECDEVGRTAAGMITVGSITALAREGNQGNTYWSDMVPGLALNSLGLPCIDPKEYSERIGDLLRYQKPIIVSLAGFSTVEFVELTKLFAGRGFSLELNLTCPNVEGKGIFAYDLVAVERTLREVREIAGPAANIIVKLNYHTDLGYIDEMTTLLNKEHIEAVALCNTVPNALVLDRNTLKSVIDPNNGLAGLSGQAIRPLVMGQVRQYRRRLWPEIDIIAEGGIWTAQAMLEYFAEGASFCRIGTMYAEKGPRALTRLTEEFVDLMEERGFTSLDHIRRFATA